MKTEKTTRGFSLVKIEDTRGCICRIQRSSSADEDAVWIFCDDPDDLYENHGKASPHPHLNADQARQVAKALLYFADGEDYKNKENAP